MSPERHMTLHHVTYTQRSHPLVTLQLGYSLPNPAYSLGDGEEPVSEGRKREKRKRKVSSPTGRPHTWPTLVRPYPLSPPFPTFASSEAGAVGAPVAPS